MKNKNAFSFSMFVFLVYLAFLFITNEAKAANEMCCVGTNGACIDVPANADISYKCPDSTPKQEMKSCASLKTDGVCKSTNESTGNTSSTSSSDGGIFNYTPMEKIPMFESEKTDFPHYLMSVYKFFLWTIGISAMLMIMIGAYMYIASAGNAAAMGKAKTVIADAIGGLLLALASWVLLYEINPDLVAFFPIGRESLNSEEQQAAKDYGSTGKYPTITATMPKNCKSEEWQKIFQSASTSTGVDKCLLQATAAMESGCNQVPQRTQGGRDCSVMQINAGDLCKSFGDCATLEANPQKAVECAANYLKSCSSKWRGSQGSDQQIRDVYAGYNGGCGALNPSSSCTGKTNDYGNAYSKWDCPIDCGGYCPVPGRTSKFLTYYNQCKSGS